VRPGGCQMECPNCGALNPDAAPRCDCGYSFVGKRVVDIPPVPPRGSWRRACWPPIWNPKSAREAAIQGVWAAGAVAVVTAAFAALSAFGIRIFGARPSAFVDAAIFAVIAIGIYKMSRAAALIGLLLHIFERGWAWATRGITGVASLPVAIILTLAFLNSVRGTFAYGKWRKKGTATGGLPPSQT